MILTATARNIRSNKDEPLSACVDEFLRVAAATVSDRPDIQETTYRDLIDGGIAEQTDRVLKNLAAVLHEAGLSLNHVAKTTVYLADMGTFAEMNEVYAKHFGDHRPARATLQAGALPKSARVEIDAIARIPS